ncbi:DUF4383 domain-containing protein [Streptomyces sp. NPDC088360]|uniref:DUF4383 domain-containing protein n=1 Tax=Streptomyces sp. NPDC088360 TaxID=3154515 RepID=UPI00344F2ECF
MKLQDELPVDHHLAVVYRYGAALCGLVLITFGCLGLADALTPLSTNGDVAGLSTNVALSVISLTVGTALILGGAIGGTFASALNMSVGTLFLLSGFYHLFTLDRPANFLDFGMTNVLFSFAAGLLILTFGMYGRVSSKLSHDNPFWRRRHPEQAAHEEDARRSAGPAQLSNREPPALENTTPGD